MAPGADLLILLFYGLLFHFRLSYFMPIDATDSAQKPSSVDIAHVYEELDLAVGQKGSSSKLQDDFQLPESLDAKLQSIDNQLQSLDAQLPAVDLISDSRTPGKSQERPVILLDPGHSGKDIASIDPETGLNDHDYPNNPEIDEVWNVTQKVGANLEAAGYHVVFTKNSAMDSVSLRERANIAQRVHADLAVSIHNDHSQKFDTYAELFAQELGLWRGGTASKPMVTFNNKSIAEASQAAAANFVTERSRAEGHPVKLGRVNFAGRVGIDPGNITQVQLYAGEGPHPVPWVYNEVGGIGFGPEQEALYVKGLTEAIKKSVPLD